MLVLLRNIIFVLLVVWAGVLIGRRFGQPMLGGLTAFLLLAVLLWYFLVVR
jgi:hypothetical protein